MGWKIIEIETAERLSLFLDNLVIYKDNDKIFIPINDIDTLIINNTLINMSLQLINKLTENNINIITCDNKHLPSSQIIPISGNYNSLKILERQINWNHKYKSHLWKEIVKTKIDNQIEILTHFGYYNDSINVLKQMKNEVKEYDITNREGYVAKIYWHNLFGTKFNRRNDENILNKYLNYGYSILRSYFSRSIIKKGLDPRISIFHKSFHNHFALASDLMEVFRIVVDFEVIKNNELKLINNNSWAEMKQKLIECFNRKVIINNKEQFLNNAIDIFIEAIVLEKPFPKIEFLLYEWS